MTRKTQSRQVEQITSLLQGTRTLLIVMQDYPDADAIASAAGLREVANMATGTQCSIAYGGIIGRAENRAMAKCLDLNFHPPPVPIRMRHEPEPGGRAQRECGAPVRKLISGFSVEFSRTGLDSRAKSAGFHKLEKLSKGEYEEKY